MKKFIDSFWKKEGEKEEPKSDSHLIKKEKSSTDNKYQNIPEGQNQQNHQRRNYGTLGPK